MLGDMFNNNRKRDVITREGQIMYRGRKYTQESEGGYYVCTSQDKSGQRKRLHVVMYEQEVLGGVAVPPGCIIHHKDFNKTHNEISNLACVTVEDHNLIHNHVRGWTGKIYDVVTGELVYEIS